jgi:hypothetical protein
MTELTAGTPMPIQYLNRVTLQHPNHLDGEDVTECSICETDD